MVPGAARTDRRLEVVWRRPGASRRRLHAQRRPDPWSGRRERRGQKHDDEDHRRRSCRRRRPMRVDGKEAHFRSSRDALAAGIGMVHQELSVAPELSVAENVFLGAQPVSRFGIVAWRRMARAGRRAVEKPRPRHRSARAARRFPDRRAAAGRTLARAVLGRAHHHSRRTDLGFVAAGDRAPVRRPGAPARRRPQHHLHFAFPRRHPEDLRRDHHLPQRPQGRDRRRHARRSTRAGSSSG